MKSCKHSWVGTGMAYTDWCSSCGILRKSFGTDSRKRRYKYYKPKRK